MEYMQIAKHKANPNFPLPCRDFAFARSFERPTCTDVLASLIRSLRRLFSKIFARISPTVEIWQKSRWHTSLSATKFAAVKRAAVKPAAV